MLSCDLVISQAETDGTLPDDPEDCTTNPDLCAQNPNDPDNPSFTLPDIELGDGLSFDSPFEINSYSFTLSWNIVDSSGSTVDFDYNFAYRYAAPDENINDMEFTDLSSSQSVFISGLNETFNGEVYTFQVLATYAPDSTESQTFTGSFSVNAVRERGLLFNPRNLTANPDGSYTAEVFIDEVQESDDLTAMSLVVVYNAFSFTVNEEDIVIRNSTGDFLNRPEAELISFKKVSTGNVTIDIGLAGTNFAPLSGGGALCSITFTPTSSFNGSGTFGFSTLSKMVNSNGSEIQILNYGQAQISQ